MTRSGRPYRGGSEATPPAIGKRRRGQRKPRPATDPPYGTPTDPAALPAVMRKPGRRHTSNGT